MTTPDGNLRIASAALSAEIAPLGAELQNLADAHGRSLQWDGDPAVWTGRAPILFPIVGMLRDGRYRLDGKTYALSKHGFARHSRFDVLSCDGRSAALRLAASDATRAVYPFEFVLDIAYALDDLALTVTASVANDGERPMPMSLGFHPAFRWPLPYGAPRADHTVHFERAEPSPIRRIDGDGLLRPETFPTPVDGDRLVLDDALFDDDAVIFDRIASRRVDFGGSDGPRVTVAFDGFPMLGLWTKPGGARFLCIEPWHGIADPESFDGELADKPGIVIVRPGESRRSSMTIALDRPPPA